jgi:hypothetical protein
MSDCEVEKVTQEIQKMNNQSISFARKNSLFIPVPPESFIFEP